MKFDDLREGTIRVVKVTIRLIYRAIKYLLFKLQEPFIGKSTKQRFSKLISLPLVPVENLDCTLAPELDPTYFTPEKKFRPNCGKCEAEVLGREIVLTASRNGRWHAIPWPVLADTYHEDLWKWLSFSYDWGKTKKNVEKLATVSRVRDDEGPEFLIVNGNNITMPNYQFNGLHDFMPIGIDTLIDCNLVNVVRDENGVDLIVPTTELVKRAKSSAEFNLTLK